MADDLAASLAHAIITAATRAAGNHSTWPIESVRAELARDLRRIASKHPARQWEAVESVGSPLWRCLGVCGHVATGPAEMEAHEVEAHEAPANTPDETDPEPWRAGAVTRGDLSDGDLSDALAGAVDAIRQALPPTNDRGYSCPDWTPDERHRHTVGGQTWEHAHEGGHEAHSAVSHDLSDSDLIFPTGTTVADDLRELAEDLDNGDVPRRAAETVRLAANLLDGAPQARPKPPSAVSEALSTAFDAARVLLHRLEHLTTEEFANGREKPEREALADALSRVDELNAAERARRYALGEEHGAMGGTL